MIFLRRAVAVTAAVFAVASVAFAQKIVNLSAEAGAVVIFRAGENGYNTYRIPTILKADDGSLLAFCEGRKNGSKDSGKIDIVMRRSLDGGKTWGGMTLVREDGENTCGNPVPVVDRKTGKIVLVSCWNDGADKEVQIEKGISKDTRRVFVQTSSDNGQSWSKAKEITRSVKLPEWTWYATGPCHAIQLVNGRKGRIVVPCNHGIRRDNPDDSSAPILHTESHLIYSDNCGKSWKLGALANDGNESTIAELPDGSLYWSMRGRRIKPVQKRMEENGMCRLTAYVDDAGKTLRGGKVTYDKKLTEPVCNGSVINYTGTDGRLSNTLLFSGPFHPEKRRNMSVRMSFNGGQTWPRAYVIRPDNAAYSDLLVLDNGDVGVLYEVCREKVYENISFVTIPAYFICDEDSRCRCGSD